MQKRKFGKTGFEVGVLGFGSTVIGFNKASQSIADRLLNTALDSGANVIDTAECYGSEEMIGRAIADRRHQSLLFTKCGHNHDTGFDIENWKPRLLELSIDQSLRRLRTDYLDLIQLHTCTDDILRQGEVITVLQKARDEGKARLIGYSGDSAAALYAVQCGAFDALQISVSIADQEAINHILPLAEQRGMGVIAKRPVANAVWRRNQRPEYVEGVYWDRLEKLKYSFLQSGEEAARIATALNFTLHVSGVHTAIVGTQRLEHWQENLAAVEAESLSENEYQAIRSRWEECASTDWIGQG